MKAPVDLDVMQHHLDEAWRAVADMCNGSRRWRMTVPVDPQRDHDVRIGDALRDLQRLIDEAKS